MDQQSIPQSTPQSTQQAGRVRLFSFMLSLGALPPGVYAVPVPDTDEQPGSVALSFASTRLRIFTCRLGRRALKKRSYYRIWPP